MGRARRSQHNAQGAGAKHEPSRSDPDRSGLVIAHHGAAITVEVGGGQRIRCTTRRRVGDLVCGDRVHWQPASPGEGVVTARLPRRSLLARPQPRGGTRPLAANLDRIVVVAALRPQPDLFLIDRYLVAAESTEIQPLIVLNKVDLVDAKDRANLVERLATYRHIGYKVLLTSAKSKESTGRLQEMLTGHVSILVGQSGVGKSSLAKALLPERDIRIGELTETQHGRHTTSTAILYHLPFGGDLIDSPGVRDFAVWHIDPGRIARAFVEFRELLGKCRFNDCSHTVEPGCAVRQAVERGVIDARRYESYRRILAGAEDRQR